VSSARSITRKDDRSSRGRRPWTRHRQRIAPASRADVLVLPVAEFFERLWNDAIVE